jgi:hypothetical protein
MICSGADQPTEGIADLVKSKVEREVLLRSTFNAGSEQDLMRVKGLRDFHNKWIKERVPHSLGSEGWSQITR